MTETRDLPETAAKRLKWPFRLTFAGLLAERTWGDFNFWVVAVPVYFGVDRWRFGIGPGVEGTRGNTEPLARLIVGYEFEGEKAHYAPGLAIDFVDGEQVYVLGVAIGFAF